MTDALGFPFPVFALAVVVAANYWIVMAIVGFGISGIYRIDAQVRTGRPPGLGATVLSPIGMPPVVTFTIVSATGLVVSAAANLVVAASLAASVAVTGAALLAGLVCAHGSAEPLARIYTPETVIDLV